MYGVRGRVKLYYYINRTSPLINTAENLNCATTFGGAPVSNYKKKKSFNCLRADILVRHGKTDIT